MFESTEFAVTTTSMYCGALVLGSNVTPDTVLLFGMALIVHRPDSITKIWIAPLRAFHVDAFLTQDRVESLADAAQIGLPTDDRLGVPLRLSRVRDFPRGARVELAKVRDRRICPPQGLRAAV